MRITQTGTTVNTTQASQATAIPNAQNGVSPWFVRVNRTSPSFVKFGDSTVTATQNDILVVPGYAQSYEVKGLGGYFATIGGAEQATAHALLTGTPIASITASTAGSGYLTVPTLTLSGNATATVKDKAVSASVVTIGSGYVVADTWVAAGGTSTTATSLDVATTQLASLATNAAGTNYKVNDVLSLVGGTHRVAAKVTVSDVQLISATLDHIGTNYQIADTITLKPSPRTPSSVVVTTAPVLTVATMGIVGLVINANGTSYVAGDVLTLTGGTFSQAAQITVDTVRAGVIVSYHVSRPGSYTVFPLRFGHTGGTGTGAQFTALMPFAAGSGYAAADTITLAGGTHSVVGVVTVDSVNAAGAVLTFHVSTAGTYTVFPSQFTQGSTSGAGTGFKSNTGYFSVLTFTVSNAGDLAGTTPISYMQNTTSGIGSGLTINKSVHGVLTAAITTSGSYTVNSSTFTVTGGSGTGATFNTALYGIATVTVGTAGAYSVLPANPVAMASSSGSGTGATMKLVWGLGAIVVAGTNTGYTGFPTITVSEIAPTPAVFTTVFTSTSIGSVVVDNPGGYYIAAPTVTPSVGTATFTATLNSTTGGVSTVGIGGTNSGETSVPSLTFSGGTLMNGAVNVVPVESVQGRVH